MHSTSSDLRRGDSASSYVFRNLPPLDHELPVTNLGDSLLPPSMVRSDAPPPTWAQTPAQPTPARPTPPVAARPTQPVAARPTQPVAARPARPRTVKPVNAALPSTLALLTGGATMITSTVLAFVYGIKLSDRHSPLPACVIKEGNWFDAPTFNTTVSDCSDQYDSYSSSVWNAENNGAGLWLLVMAGGALASCALGASAGSATEAIQKWSHRRQLRLAAAEAAARPAATPAPAAGIEMV